MNLFVLGYFGNRNLGDEAILEVFLEWAQRNVASPDFRVLSSRPEETEKQYNVGTVNKNNLRGIISSMRWCDAVVAPGGGLLQDSTSARSIIYYVTILFIARLFRRPVYMLSQGIGPFRRKWTKRISAFALDRCCTRMWVRDEGSAALLEEMGLIDDRFEISADIVFMARSLFKEKIPQPQLYKGVLGQPGAPSPLPPSFETTERPVLKIGISLRPCSGLDHVTGALERCLARLMTTYRVEVYLFAFDASEDSAPINRFAAEIRRAVPEITLLIEGETKERPLLLAETIRKIGDLDVFIGMRLHSLIFSTIAATKFVALPYDPKVLSFAKASGKPYVENLETVSALELTNRIEQLLKEPDWTASCELCDFCNGSCDSLNESLNEFLAGLGELKGKTPIIILGTPVSGMSFNGTVRKIIDTTRSDKKLHIVTVNPEMIMRARNDPEFRELLRSGTMNTADGVGVRLAALIKYRRWIEPVTGVALTSRLLEISAREGLKIFFLGSKPEVIEEVKKRLAEHPSKPLVAGTHHGYLKEIDPAALALQIKESGAGLLLAGMGVPLQEYWIRENAEKIGASVFIGVGGVFDVLAGKTSRAPGIMQKLGIEWVWRVMRQPSRIGRIASLPFFVLLAVLDAIRPKK